MSSVTAVTGATGFLGMRLCETLVARGERVIAMGRDFSRFPALDAALCRPVACELADPLSLRRALAGSDVVIHAAALSAAWGRRSDFMRVNVDGTEAVLTAARQAGARRFVHVSSSSVVFVLRDAFDVSEKAPPPRHFPSFYAESKAVAECVVRDASGIETVIVRPRGIFGPRDPALLPRILALAARGKLRIIGEGRNVQDLTYVDNVVEALLLARNAVRAPGNTYFISNGEHVLLWDLIAEVLKGLGLRTPQRRVSLKAALAWAGALETLHRALPMLGEPQVTRYAVGLLGCHQTLDISAARRDLQYSPTVRMAPAIGKTIDWFRREFRG
jgi:nucleoside-diphosphate-sugar epimerase